MTCYELIKANQSLLQLMKENQITVNDVETLQIYEEFRAMKKHNHKTVYCVAVLADKYEKSQRTIYNIIDHFRKNVTMEKGRWLVPSTPLHVEWSVRTPQ